MLIGPSNPPSLGSLPAATLTQQAADASGRRTDPKSAVTRLILRSLRWPGLYRLADTDPANWPRTLWLEPLGLTVTDAAAALGVSRKTLSALLNGRAGISPEMAVRLSMAFGTSAESWLNQQMQYDLWHAERRRKSLKVVRIAA